MKNWQPTVINEIAKKLQDAHLFKAFMLLFMSLAIVTYTWDQNGC